MKKFMIMFIMAILALSISIVLCKITDGIIALISEHMLLSIIGVELIVAMAMVTLMNKIKKAFNDRRKSR